MMLQTPLAIAENGFAIFSGIIEADLCERLCSSFDALVGVDTVTLKERVGGIRNLLEDSPDIRYLARSRAFRDLVEPILGAECVAVRAILFDKTPAANWKVPWHQDLTIAVRGRVDTLGYGPWTVKAGVHHVQPPTLVLEGMLSVRLHLDPCGVDNGPLHVLPGSHLSGRLKPSAIQSWREKVDAHLCTADVGAILLMRPLLLHASSSSLSPAHRRIVHIDYATAALLPSGIQWHTECGVAERLV